MKTNPTFFHASLYARCDKMGEMRSAVYLPFGTAGLDRVRDSVHIVGPGTSFAILACVGFSVFLVS